MTIAPKKHPRPMTAAEFFELNLSGFSKTDAHFGARLSYTVVLAATKSEIEPSKTTLLKLQAWSLSAAKKYGVYISAAKTLGLIEPTSEELAAAP